MKPVSFPFLSALPSYFGGKRKHLPWILGHLAQAIPRAQWSQFVFLDAFLGGGAVSMAAKALGFQQVLSNDWSFRSQLIAKALLCNNRMTIEMSDLLWLNQELPDGTEPGLLESDYCPSVLSLRQARQMDRWLFGARQMRMTRNKPSCWFCSGIRWWSLSAFQPALEHPIARMPKRKMAFAPGIP